uniref:Uncharacterized protein n=1 Tax=Arundo donax TaxID=35708 RepID=A0A0A9DZT4_ARUDO
MPGTLVVYVAHTDNNPWLPSCANKAILLWIPLLKTLHNFLNIFLMLLLPKLLRLHGRPHLSQIDTEVDQCRYWKGHEDNRNPSKLHQVVY